MEDRGLVRPADSGRGTWNCGVSEEKVSFHRDLVLGIGICFGFIDRPGVGLNPVIQLCPSACLQHIKGEVTPGLVLKLRLRTAPCRALGAQRPADEEIATRRS